MVSGGNVSWKRNLKKRSRYGTESDDSDEDYVVSDDTEDVSHGSSEEYCSSLDGCESEGGFDSLVKEETVKNDRREEKGSLRKLKRSKEENGIGSQLKKGDKTSRKRGRTECVDQLEEEDDEEFDDDEDENEDDKDGDDDSDYDGKDNDVEFTPDEDVFSDEEELNERKWKNKRACKKKNPVRCHRRRSLRVSKKPLRNKRRKTYGSRKEVESDDETDSIDSSLVFKERGKRKTGRRKRRLVVHSDSNFGSSGSSYHEYTISEEEREQIREAKKLCGSFRTNKRSSSVRRKIEDTGDIKQQRKPLARKGKEKIAVSPGRKGKEKIENIKTEMVKQVCGICLSEEDKRRVRGVLNCCTHYFCFACIMEWAKVESRCPLCKQRFTTISKPARSMAGIDLREVVIQVPERDQVYQPSEEELRSYIDPYEYVICTECHHGGDDHLMLLCDFCDSPAHTYCVGLGQEVPEGNWYCEGCRPVALGSSSSQVRDGMSDPRFSFRGLQGASSVSGRRAPTLSGRRWVQRQFGELHPIGRQSYIPSRIGGISTSSSIGSNLYNSQFGQSRATTMPGGVETSFHTFLEEVQNRESVLTRINLPRFRSSLHTFLEEVQNRESFLTRYNNARRHAAQDATRRRGTSFHTFLEEVQNRDSFLSGTRTPQRQVVQDATRVHVLQGSTTASINIPVNVSSHPELTGMNALPDHGQPHHSSRTRNIDIDVNVNPDTTKEENDFRAAKEQLQSMVDRHLKNSSRDIDLGEYNFEDIANSSTDAILAACGLAGIDSDACLVPPPSVCSHIELGAGGQRSLFKGCCSSCFDSYVGGVVKSMLVRMPQWLRLGL